MKAGNRSFPIPKTFQSFDLIKCPQCEIVYVLFAQLGEIDSTVFLDQVDSQYCPYCGTKVKEA